MQRSVTDSRSEKASGLDSFRRTIGKAGLLGDLAIRELLDHIARELAQKFLDVARGGSAE